MIKPIPKIISFCLALYLFLSTQVTATEDIYTIYNDSNTLKKTLDNGMTVVIHQIYKTPIAAINITVRTGSATEGKFSGSGISHLVEHMLFKGDSEKNIKNYNERIKLLGGSINGFTSHDYTSYEVTVPKEYVVDALKILKDIIGSPSFDALELKKEKGVILDEIRRNNDDPARLAFDLSWMLTFKEHPYKYPIVGYDDLFERLDKKDLEDYYSISYSPHRMILVISGDIKKRELLKEVVDIFGPLRRNFIPSFSNISEPLQLAQRQHIEYRPISLAHVVLSYRSASINDTAFYPLDILALVLGKGEDSILTKELRDKKKLVHQIVCQNYTLRDSGLFSVYFIADITKVNDAINAIVDELENIKINGISDADLNKVKEMATAELINALETAGGRAKDISISEAIANDYKFSQIYLKRLLDVTGEEAKSAANAYFKVDFLNTVLVLPELKEEAIVDADLTQQFGRKMTKEIMPNGMRILMCEDHSTPTCSMSVLFLGGVRAENNTNNGITYLVSKLLLDGTAKKTESDIKSEIESKGGDIENISGNNSFGVMLNLLSRDWRKGIEIISDIITNSVFSEERIQKEKTLALAAIKERDDDIIQSGLLLFKQNFFKEHPYRFDILGTINTVQNLNRTDIVNYYNSLGVPGNMVLAITGDINTNEVIGEVKNKFNAFKRIEPKLPRLPTSKIPEEKNEISHSMKKEQSLIIVGFPSVKLTDNERYIFEVIDSLMSGSNGRMFSNIRDKIGVAYALGSFFHPGLEPGYHVFYALVSRQNIDIVKEAILNEIKLLKDKTVSDEELEAAKRYLITSTMADLQSNKAFNLKIALDELYGLGYRNFETYNAKINSVTASQVKRVANQYFDLKKCLIIVIYGEG